MIYSYLVLRYILITWFINFVTTLFDLFFYFSVQFEGEYYICTGLRNTDNASINYSSLNGDNIYTLTI